MRFILIFLLFLSLCFSAQAQTSQADKDFQQHNYAEALEGYRKTHQQSPSDELRYKLMQTLFKLQHWDDLLEALKIELPLLKDDLLRARSLHLAAQIYQSIPHQGYRRDDKVWRSQEHREGDYVWMGSEDQQQVKHYFFEARKQYETLLNNRSNSDLLREAINFNTELSAFLLQELWIAHESKDWPQLKGNEAYPVVLKQEATRLEQVWHLYQENLAIARQLQDSHQQVIEQYRWATILLNSRGNEQTNYPDRDPLLILKDLAQQFSGDKLIPEIRLLMGEVLYARKDYSAALESWQMVLNTALKEQAEARIQELTWPRLNLSSSGVLPANSIAPFKIAGRNLEQIHFELYQVPLDRVLQDPVNLYKSQQQFKDYVKNLGGSFKQFREVTSEVQEWDWKPQPETAYAPFEAQLKLPKSLPAGAYLLEAHTAKVRTALLIVLSDVVLTSQQDNQRVIYYVANANTGHPVPNANLSIREITGYGSNQKVRAYKVKTDDRGMYSFYSQDKSTDNHYYEAFAAWENNFALSNMAYWSYHQEADNWKIYSYTDRPLYRPGQEVNFRQMLRLYQQGEYKNQNQPLEVRVTNPKGEEIYKQLLTPNRFGSLNGSIKLPENATLGAYHFNFRIPDSPYSVYPIGRASFQVEEYKKPEFTVSVKPDATLPGDKAKATIEAKYLFGGAVSGAQVQYKVSRRAYWPYWGYEYWFEDSYRGRDNSSEQVLQATGSLNEKGQLQIEFPTNKDQDSVYTIEAQVTDASRREVTQSKTLTVTKLGFFANIRLDQGFYQEGDRVSGEIVLQDPNQQVVAKQTGTVIIERITSQKDDKIEVEKVYSQPVTSDERGLVFVRWQSTLGGKYRLRFESRDRREQLVEAKQEFWVAGNGFEGRAIRLKGVELVTDKRQYAPGDNVEVLIQTDRPDSHVWLTQESDDAILSSDLLWVKGRSTIQRFKLKNQHQPNFMIRALSIADRQLFSDQKELFVPALQHQLKINLKTDQADYQPGSSGKLQIEVRDQANQPVETELSLAMIDAALYQLMPDNTADVHQALYGERRYIDHRLDHSLNMYFGDYVDYLIKQKDYDLKSPYTQLPGLRRQRAGFDGEGFAEMSDAIPHPSAVAPEAQMKVAQAPGKEKKDANASDEALVEPGKVRSEFKDTAYWNPSVVTNALGKAELKIDFPDNLTTWKLLSRGWDQKNKVGQGGTDVKTRQDLMLRLQHPRFLTEGDQVTISANINNDLAQTQKISVTLKTDAALGLTSPVTQEMTVPAKGQVRVDWQAKVLKAGNSTLTAEVRGSKGADAVKQSLPVQIYGALKTESKSGSTQDTAKFSLTLPAQRKPEQTQLRLTLQPSLASTLLDALPYLAEYPYGCIEQTTSRFVPAVLVSKTLTDLGIDLDQLGKQLDVSAKAMRIKQPLANRQELAAMIADGLKRIANGQRSDGGWGWWPGADRSDPYMTTYVLDALQLAVSADLAVDANMLNQGLNYLAGNFKETDSGHLKAYQALVLSRAKRLQTSDLKLLFDKRDQLNTYSKALLAMALYSTGDQENAKLILQNLKSFVRRDAASQTASWDHGNQWWYWYGDRIETNATVLQAFNLISPQDPLVADLMRWLVFNREGNRWYSTKDTARAVYALSGYLQQSKELKADFNVALKLNGKTIKQHRFRPEQALAGPIVFDLPDSVLQTGANQIEFVKTGSGTLYYSAALKVFSREDKIPAGGQRLEVKRSYFKVSEQINPQTKQMQVIRIPLAEGAMLISGDEVEVRLEIKAPNDYEYLLFEDFKPAGFEAVETLSGYDYQNGAGIYKEFRDNRVSMFMGQMPQGTQVLTYRLRAETPGIFAAMPHRAEAMYAPQIHATSESMNLKIVDK